MYNFFFLVFLLIIKFIFIIEIEKYVNASITEANEDVTVTLSRTEVELSDSL